jgi:hypothetical protein
MDETVRAVKSRYDDVLAQDTIACAEEFGKIELLDVYADVPFDITAFEHARDYARREYFDLRLSGTGTQNALALLALMQAAGQVGDKTVVFAKRELRRLYEEGGGPAVGKLIVSVFDLMYWIDAFEQVTDDATWIVTLPAARACLSHADTYRDSAVHEPTFEQFHRSLYIALAYYLAASRLFGIVAGEEPTRVRAPLYAEAVDRMTTCEEMRARIEVSLGWAVDVNPMGYNLTYPQRLEDWVLSLLQESADKAMIEIYNLGSQLAFPEVVREAALALIDLAQGRYRNAVQRASRSVAFMEADIRFFGVAEWGLGYFAYSVGLAQRGLELLGDAAQAREFAQRLQPAWLHDKLDKITASGPRSGSGVRP